VTPLNGVDVRAYNLPAPTPEGTFCPLRQSYYKLPLELYLKAGKCAELLYWDRNTRFCGVCGGPMRFHTDISKRCTECGKEVWPQLATAIIVLIRRGADEVLLAHARNFRTNFYGLIAGFVETGETLEEAVCREVMEETGLQIKNIRYFGSQPWPYPSGLMVGFTADYAGGRIHVQREELTKCAWFRRDHLPTLPEKLSIARKLIDAWLDEG
jgi:NAD+ diphosphatase